MNRLGPVAPSLVVAGPPVVIAVVVAIVTPRGRDDRHIDRHRHRLDALDDDDALGCGLDSGRGAGVGRNEHRLNLLAQRRCFQQVNQQAIAETLMLQKPDVGGVEMEDGLVGFDERDQQLVAQTLL